MGMSGMANEQEDDIFRILVSHQGEDPWSVDSDVSSKKPFKYGVFGYLVNISDSLLVEPGLLENWHWDFEEKRYVFRLRKDLKFHNGRAVTSTDLEFSLVRWFLMTKPSFEKAYVPSIKGIETLRPGDKFKSGSVPGIKIIDDQSMTIEVSVFNPTFLHSLIDIPLVPMEELQDDYYTWKGMPVGAGPLKAISYDKGTGEMKLEVVAPQTKKHPKRIYMYTKDSKDVVYDITTKPPNNEDQFTVVKLSQKHDWVGHILINHATDLGRDKNFRKALYHGINRSEIARLRHKHAQAIAEIIPPSFWGSSAFKDPYDLELAKSFIAKIPKALKEKAYKVPSYTGEKPLHVIELEKQLQRLGLDFELVSGWTKFSNPELPPIKIVQINTSSPDPLLQFSFFKEGSPLINYFPENNHKFEKLFNNGAIAPSFDVKVKTISELSNYFKDEVFSVPTHAVPPVFFINKQSKFKLGNQRSSVSFFLDRVEKQ